MITGALIVSAFAITGYVVNRDAADRGITTGVALVVTYVLGLLALDQPLLAPAVAVVMTWVLAIRGELHRLVLRSLTERELRDALLFLLIALVVVPLAPDRAYGPYGAVNPQSLARLVVVLMAITGGGYVAQRLISPRLGLAVAGFASGFVSSSATIAAMSLRARDQPSEWRAAVAGGLSSSVATVLQYVVVVAALDPGLAFVIAPSMGLAGLTALGLGGVFAWLSLREGGVAERPTRPFRLWAALGFAGVFVGVSIASSAVADGIGEAGVVIVSGVAALVDAHSTAGSVASLHRAGAIDAGTAQVALLTALTSNSLTKIVLAWSGRHARYAWNVTLGVLAIAVSAWLGLLLGPG